MSHRQKKQPAPAIERALLAEAEAWRECAERMDSPPLNFLRWHLTWMAGYYALPFVPRFRDTAITPTITEDTYRRMVSRQIQGFRSLHIEGTSQQESAGHGASVLPRILPGSFPSPSERGWNGLELPHAGGGR